MIDPLEAQPEHALNPRAPLPAHERVTFVRRLLTRAWTRKQVPTRAEPTTPSEPRARSNPLWWLARYLAPHLFGMGFGVAVAWLVRSLSVMGGACRVLCYPPVTIGMGVVGGLLGAHLYRSNHPVDPPEEEPLVPQPGPARVRTRRPRLRPRL